MKIVSFNEKSPFLKVLRELQGHIVGKNGKKELHPCDNLTCLCISKVLFQKYEALFLQFNPKVEDNVTVKVHAEFSDQIPWGVESLGGTRLWRKGYGKGVRVAVIDTGIDRNHPDLRGQVKGRIHLVKGKIGGHGTHVAGIIAAAMNNRGIVGVSPQAELYDVKAFKANGTARLFDIIRGIDWSIQNRMQVINMSFGMPEASEALRRVIKKAHAAGIKMVASAGNNGGAVEYPARFPQVISVGALDQNGKLAEFSSRGKGLSVRAPGVKIYSTWPGGRFRTLDGTSMAAAHVTGLTALKLAKKVD